MYHHVGGKTRDVQFLIAINCKDLNITNKYCKMLSPINNCNYCNNLKKNRKSNQFISNNKSLHKSIHLLTILDTVSIVHSLSMTLRKSCCSRCSGVSLCRLPVTWLVLGQMTLSKMALSQGVGGNRSKERDRKSELVLRSTYQIFERDRNNSVRNFYNVVRYVHIPLVP